MIGIFLLGLIFYVFFGRIKSLSLKSISDDSAAIITIDDQVAKQS